MPATGQALQPSGGARLASGFSTFGLGLAVGIAIGSVLVVTLFVALVIFG